MSSLVPHKDLFQYKFRFKIGEKLPVSYVLNELDAWWLEDEWCDYDEEERKEAFVKFLSDEIGIDSKFKRRVTRIGGIQYLLNYTCIKPGTVPMSESLKIYLGLLEECSFNFSNLGKQDDFKKVQKNGEKAKFGMMAEKSGLDSLKIETRLQIAETRLKMAEKRLKMAEKVAEAGFKIIQQISLSSKVHKTDIEMFHE